jgi:predicted transcriptional regulator
MATKTLTFSVNTDVEEKFRRVARATKGSKKGYLGRALTDAMEKWATDMEGADSVAAAMALLDQGLDLGGMRYEHRDELHDR